MRIEDTIDPTVGFTSELKIGDKVKAGDAIGVVYCADAASGHDAAKRIQAAYRIGEEPPLEAQKLVKEIINE